MLLHHDRTVLNPPPIRCLLPVPAALPVPPGSAGLRAWATRWPMSTPSWSPPYCPPQTPTVSLRTPAVCQTCPSEPRCVDTKCTMRPPCRRRGPRPWPKIARTRQPATTRNGPVPWATACCYASQCAFAHDNGLMDDPKPAGLEAEGPCLGNALIFALCMLWRTLLGKVDFRKT